MVGQPGALLPNTRVAARVKNRDHNDTADFVAENDRVWKPAHPDATDVAVHSRKALRVGGRQVDGAIDPQDELNAQAAPSLLVP